jgi:hypothetical protein
MNNNFCSLCSHSRINRINNDFIRCLTCGESFPNKLITHKNKTIQDFAKESPGFMKNFDRNFTNVIDQNDIYYDEPNYEYYVDASFLNKIIVDKKNLFNSDIPTYRVNINNKVHNIDSEKLQHILDKIGAIKIDKRAFYSSK